MSVTGVPGRPSSRRVRPIVRTLLIGAVAFGAGAAATAAAPGGGAGTQTAGDFAPEAPVSAVPAAESASFGVLRRAQGAADAFGPATVAATPAGANPALARSVAVPTSSLSAGRVWVMPADDAICLRVVDPLGGDGWVCSTTSDAVAGRLIGAMRSSTGDTGPAFVHGLVPDGVAEVTVTGPTGGTVDVPVTDNVYATTIPATPATVTYTPSDAQSVVLDVP
jgi:hypothetical protein